MKWLYGSRNRVPNSQFVFMTINEVVGTDLRRRLGAAFAAAGLSAESHCRICAEMSLIDYWNLHWLGNVSLDTLSWSGCVTSFEALACGLPIVTPEGTLMRSRQTYAILTQLGVTDTIALADEDYVEISARLGLDRAWRQSVVQKIVNNYPHLYSDTRWVRDLETFYRRAVKERIG